MTTTTHRLRTQRSRFYRDYEGVLTTSKRHDETIKEAIDVNPDLDGETISSVVVTTTGPTISGVSHASGIVTMTVVGSGYATMKVTTSGSRVLHYRLQWRAQDIILGDYT